MSVFFSFLELLDDLLWSYVSLAVILITGFYFTFKSRFYQIKVLISAKKHFKELTAEIDHSKVGVHPIKLYFASLGGMVGIGNLVAVVATVTIGGPGSLVWLWIASFIGMIVKYAEIYLGMSYRIPNEKNDGYDGGPMHYLGVAFGNRVVPIVFCFFLCIYGAEVSQFLIITDTISNIVSCDRMIVVCVLIFLVLLGAIGGVKRLANLCSILLPPFLMIYIAMALYIFIIHYQQMPAVLLDVVSSAFTGHAPLGGFVGSTFMMSAHYGVSRAVYSGDIGIGYDSTVLSESQSIYPEKQAKMAIFSLFADTVLCTISILIVLVTGVWQSADLQMSKYIVTALVGFIPYADIFMLVLFFIAGYTTIVGYLVVGQKCAKFLSPQYGRYIYILYAIFAFAFFSYYSQATVMLVMSVSGGVLLIMNLCGILRLRNVIKFP